MTVLFGATIFLSALLLFSVQPMVGKMILPRFGGTPAVWNTCMLVYQLLLLAGYAYGHFACRMFGVRRQSLLHVVVLSLPLFVLPISFSEAAIPPADSNPTIWLIGQIAFAVSLPFFVVSTTAPLLQRWLAFANRDRDPYFLYAISNAGSLLALLSYPLFVESAFSVEQQSQLWHFFYISFLILLSMCAFAVRRQPDAGINGTTHSMDASTQALPSISWSQRFRWILLSMVPCSLMLGVTTYVTTEIASAPLLWILPLVLYLLTFILVFSDRRLLPHNTMLRVFPFVILIMSLLMFANLQQKQWLMFPFHMVGFFVVTMVCHGELARLRPPGPQLTEFYLWMGVGGALGGIINGFVAPIVFNSVIEYPAMLVISCFLIPRLANDSRPSVLNRRDLLPITALALLTIGLTYLIERFEIRGSLAMLGSMGFPALVCFGFKDRPRRFAIGIAIVVVGAANMANIEQGRSLFAERGFFGVNRVTVDDTDKFHQLINGRTCHGLQQVKPEVSTEPLAYYHRSGPIGDVFRSLHADPSLRNIAVVGLGAGTMASYIRPQEHITFFEIDPVVRDIATDPTLFTFLSECEGQVDIVLGDARLRLEEVSESTFDVIVIDAFSSDSIPAHLLTVEAFDLYLSKLKTGGMLVFHVSNKYLRIEPLIAQAAMEKSLVGRSRFDNLSGDPQPVAGKRAAHYIALARDIKDLGALATLPHWNPLEQDSTIRLWTDGYSNLLSLLRW